jgi:WD40 repeat protein
MMIERYTEIVNAVAWSPDGRFIASGFSDGTVSQRQTFSGRESFRKKCHRYVNSRSPNGRHLAVAGSAAQGLQLWEGESGTLEKKLTPSLSLPGSALAWAPDGKVIAHCVGRAVDLWLVRNGKRLRTYLGHSREVFGVAWSPCGKLIVSGGNDKEVHLWDTENGQLSRTLQGHTDRVGHIAWSPDGRLIAAGSWDGLVRIWRPDIASLVDTF